MTIKETAQWLTERNDYLLITHTRPDGDTLCSAAALAAGLRRMGKRAYLLRDFRASAHLSQYVEKYYAPADFLPAYVVAVDTAGEEQFPENGLEYRSKTALCIDHHPSNTGYAKHLCLNAQAAACGEIIYQILLALNGGVDREEAKQLYIALSTDTGCFAYANTNYETLLTAAELVKAGAPNAELNKTLFRTKSRNRIQLEGMIMERLEFYQDGRIAVSTVTQEMLRTAGVTENELDDIAAIPGQVRGVLAGVTIKETKEKNCRISLRTLEGVNASHICAKFGGGGHAMAAGCTIYEEPEEAKIRIVRAIEPELLTK